MGDDVGRYIEDPKDQAEHLRAAIRGRGHWVLIAESAEGHGRLVRLATALLIARPLEAEGGRMVPLRLADRKGGDITEFPMDLQIREFPGST